MIKKYGYPRIHAAALVIGGGTELVAGRPDRRIARVIESFHKRRLENVQFRRNGLLVMIWIRISRYVVRSPFFPC